MRLVVSKLSRFSVALCGIALALTLSAVQMDRSVAAAGDKPEPIKIIKIIKNASGQGAHQRQTTTGAAGFHRAAQAMRRVRFVRELETLKQGMAAEGLLARWEMEREKRLAYLAGAAWRFGRILGAFERGDEELGIDAVHEPKLASRTRKTRAAWNAFMSVIREARGPGKVDGDYVRGLTAAGSWLDLEVEDLVRTVEDGARRDGVVVFSHPMSAAVAE